jgi:glutamate 5-kinase
MEVMLENGVLPIVNENDTVSVTELMFTDNDELSGLIARMIRAEALVLLSNIDGLYTGDPAQTDSRLIERVEPGTDLSHYVQAEKSSLGRGGMQSKYHTATATAALGIRVYIANGRRPDILPDLLCRQDSNVPHTEFVPDKVQELNKVYNQFFKTKVSS